MGSRPAIVGAGSVGFAPTTPGRSYKELMFEAARRAYEEAGLDPRRDVDSFVACSEDLQEGTSIFDEYVPDQLGAVQRPVHTVAGDGLQGLATAVMLLRSGIARVVVVEAHSKASDVATQGRVDRFALDPVWNRPLEVAPEAIAGLEMRAYLTATGTTEEQCALVASANRRAALANSRAAFGAELSVEEVAGSPPTFDPLRELEAARPADGCVVLVLAEEERARELDGQPVWVDGVGWASASPTLESRDWARAEAAEAAATIAYRQAGIRDPRRSIRLAEVDDTYAYKELQHLEALGFAEPGAAGRDLEAGRFAPDGELPVNRSGGALGEGYLHEANGLARALACVEQLRGEAGERRAGRADVAVAQSWRGVPSATCAVAVLSRDGGSR